MALFDDQWFTGLQTAVTGVATAIVGAVTAWFALRKKVSNDTADIKVSGMQIGWIERLVKEREEDKQRIESLRESQLNDARANERLKAECAACHERLTEAQIERDQAREETTEANRRRAAAEEKNIMLVDEVLDLRLANGRVFAALSAIDMEAANRLIELHLKPSRHQAEPGEPT